MVWYGLKKSAPTNHLIKIYSNETSSQDPIAQALTSGVKLGQERYLF